MIILDALYRHKIDKFGLLCIVAAFIGYTCIYLSPAQWNNKSAELSLRILLYNFKDATSVYSSFGILACIALILLILNHYQKTDIKTILLGFVFILGSLAANYIMVFASYYHERSAVAAFTLLLTAIMILLTPLLGNLTWKPLIVCASSVLILSCFPVMLSAGLDIVYSYLHVMENRRCITECKENGIYDVVLPLVYPSTEYSAFYDMKYLDIEDVHSWPNESMAQYYGVDSILGTE